MEQTALSEARSLIDTAEHIVITTHKSPDGDAIGSSLAMKMFLEKLGKDDVSVIVPDNFPEFLKWMPNSETVHIYEDDQAGCEQLISRADLLFSLDYNHLNRIQKLQPLIEASEAPSILIDHHQQPDSFPRVTFSDTSSCSTAQMIFQFIDGMGKIDLIDVDIAECIYCGIMTDSGSFRFPAVTSETHEIVSRLIDLGLDHSYVHRQVYDTNQLDRLRLLGFALSNKLEVLEEYHTALISLSHDELMDHNYRPGDTEGLVNYALSMTGINLAAFIREGNNQVRMSFRSKGDFDVNQFARAHFNGGGHKNAAGGSSSLSLTDTIDKFKSDVTGYKENLNY